MTPAPYDDDTTGQVELREGRRAAPGTWAPDWVALSGIPGEAVKLYQLLRMRLNDRRRDRRSQVWPSTASLAVMMGFAQSSTVSKWLQVLKKLGAIDIHGEGMPRRNVYTVHDLPPDEYDGPVTLKDWDDDPANRLAAAAIRREEKGKRERAKAKAKGQVSPDTRENGYLEETPESDAPGTGQNRYLGTDENGYLDTGQNRCLDTGVRGNHSSREPDLKEPPSSKPPSVGAPNVGSAVTAEEADDPCGAETRTAQAVEILTVVQKRGGVPPAGRLRGRQLAETAAAVAERLTQGWVPEDLHEALKGRLDDVRYSVFGVLRYRIQELGEPPTRSTPSRPREPRCETHPGGYPADGCPLCAETALRPDEALDQEAAKALARERIAATTARRRGLDRTSSTVSA